MNFGMSWSDMTRLNEEYSGRDIPCALALRHSPQVAQTRSTKHNAGISCDINWCSISRNCKSLSQIRQIRDWYLVRQGLIPHSGAWKKMPWPVPSRSLWLGRCRPWRKSENSLLGVLASAPEPRNKQGYSPLKASHPSAKIPTSVLARSSNTGLTPGRELSTL